MSNYSIRYQRSVYFFSYLLSITVQVQQEVIKSKQTAFSGLLCNGFVYFHITFLTLKFKSLGTISILIIENYLQFLRIDSHNDIQQFSLLAFLSHNKIYVSRNQILQFSFLKICPH